MTDARYLVHGVFWDGAPAQGPEHDGGCPVLRVQPAAGALTDISLEPGAALGFRLAA